ncbi:MAG: sigma-70 family RNA polymerase sigma factor [Clostridiales bacterium]|nr:sigma-70 family RNA polymerase sigma factor [Clostridiales bacterium]
MTIQEARAELKQIGVLYHRIAERKQRLAQLRESMASIRLTKYGNQPTEGATTLDNYRLENAIDRCTTLEIEIADDIATMAETQQALIAKIEMLPEPYATVLSKRYIHLQRFEKIADDINYSYRTVKRYCVTGTKKFADL